MLPCCRAWTSDLQHLRNNVIDFLGETEHWNRIRWKLEQLDAQAFADLTDELSRHDVEAELDGIDCPVTIMVGEHDDPFVDPSRRMAEAIPNARLEVIADAAHSPQYENAQAWMKVINEHLDVNGH